MGMLSLKDECEVLEAVQKQYKVTPVNIEPWISAVRINANATSSQSLVYTWRFAGQPQTSGPVTADLKFPFFIGKVNLNINNPDPVGVSAGNSFAIVNNYFLNSIGTFYNLESEQIIRYGVGTYNGKPFPAPGQNETLDNLPPDVLCSSPYFQVQVFTDAAGVVFLEVYIKFEGFRISLA